MRNGGTVLVRHARPVFLASTPATPAPTRERLREILANLDIPPLEPVPPDHVLTKSFYLLTEFPRPLQRKPALGRGALEPAAEPETRPARSGDGVTPIMITGNDFAGAWAIDANGEPLLPTVPPDEIQREHASTAPASTS